MRFAGQRTSVADLPDDARYEHLVELETGLMNFAEVSALFLQSGHVLLDWELEYQVLLEAEGLIVSELTVAESRARFIRDIASASTKHLQLALPYTKLSARVTHQYRDEVAIIEAELARRHG